MTQFRKLVALDFDGVLHAYTSPWTDAATISDPPTPGAMEFLKSLVEDDRFTVGLVSSRLATDEGCHAVEHWLGGHLRASFGIEQGQAIKDEIVFYTERPPAFLTIDDRGWQFDGTWPDLDAVAAFRPWNKRPAVDRDPMDEITRDHVEMAIIEQDLTRAFGRVGPIERLKNAHGRVSGWSILGHLVAARALLPVQAPVEPPEITERRRRIVNMLRAAFDVGQASREGREAVSAEYDAEAVRIASEGIPVRVYQSAVMVEDEEGGRG